MFSTLQGYAVFLVELFFSKQFIVHRLFGLLYLIQFVLALYWYFADYELFYNSVLVWSLPLNGIVISKSFFLMTITLILMDRLVAIHYSYTE